MPDDSSTLKPSPTPAQGDRLEEPHYHERLLAVYRYLKTKNLLQSDLPVWANEIDLLTPGKKDAEEILLKSPRLQRVLATSTAYTPSKWLLEQELSRRDSTKGRKPGLLVPPDSEIPLRQPASTANAVPTGGEAQNIPAEEPGKSWPSAEYHDVYDAAAAERLTGLCFSGGGVRSATFCLGVLQALAEIKKLRKVDYLSTVSGGGYIHEWFASWIHNDKGSLAGVEKKLRPLPEKGSEARTAEPIRWLRRYSSYLTPQRGIASVDTWTMLAIWFRNTFLNQIVLFGFLASCLLLVRGLTYPFVMHFGPYISEPSWAWILGVVLFAIVAFSLTYAASSRLWKSLSSVTDKISGSGEKLDDALDNRGVACWLVMPSFLMAMLAALEADPKPGLGSIDSTRIFFIAWACFVAAMVLAMTFGVRPAEPFRNSKEASQGNTTAWYFFLPALFCVALVVFGAWALTNSSCGQVPRLYSSGEATARFLNQHLVQPSPKLKIRGNISSEGTSIGTLDFLVPAPEDPTKTPFDSNDIYLTFAPVMIFFLQFLAIRLQLGIIGRFCYESRREWLARFGGWSMIVACVWILLSGIVRIGPDVCKWLFEAHTLRVIWGIVSVMTIHAVTLYAGASGKSDGKPKPGTLLGYSALDLVGMIGAPLCILSLLVLAASLIQWFLGLWPSSATPFLLFLIVLVTFLFFGWRVDVNEFSMHGFYRNRLARCYLGCNNPNRTPDPFTGFDDHEETGTAGIRLSDLRPKKFGGTVDSDNPDGYDGPFPIFCSTLNLTFGEDLATQERKGASFAFTSLYSGYHVGWTSVGRKDDPDIAFNGFVPTRKYAYGNRGIPLSYVAAISGAALSPNQGYNSQPALAFLMTLFNVRLNWWIANPRKRDIWPSAQNKPNPRFGLFYLLSELFGLSNDTSKYVCLCDGGFFENMGLYELVRRRCSEIVICDAECDTNTVFEGIGNAVAKCRADFGAEISLDLNPLIPDPATGRASAHFITGTIRYPAPPGGDTNSKKYLGKILYLKTSFVGDETADLLHHKRAFPDFPQDSTADQWFNESQFESYRRLGQLIAESALRE